MSEQNPTEIAQPADHAPEDFVTLVQDALRHLYDYAHLQRHPLASLVSSDSSSLEDRARLLRNFLLDALERLNPGESVSRNDPTWRPYVILMRRYVDGFSAQQIMNELLTSLRQYQRDHRKGLLAVADSLWGRWQQQRAIPQEQSLAGDEGLSQEIEHLGLALQRVDLGALVKGFLELANALARKRSIWLQTRPPPYSVAILADPTLARQALLGALSALIAVGPNRIEISWESEKENASLVIQAEPSLDNSAPDGVGKLEVRLAATEKLMRAQNGRLEALYREGRLRGVRASFPIARGVRVLVIDDNERVLQLFERYLGAYGYIVAGASDASRALEALEREKPGALILDVMMRDVDGWQLLQQLRARADLQRTPIIVCTVLNEPELAFALGATYYLKKPVSQQQLLAALREVLRESSLAGPRPGAP